MAADFFFINPTFTIQSLKPVAVFKWQRLGNPEVQYAIAAEEQYLNFHLFMLNNIRHTQASQISQPPYVYELGLSVRAGAVKAAVLIAASIVEAALRALAEARGYPLNENPLRRTFGNVIRAWEVNKAPRNEVAAIWANVKAMHEVRNFVHLHKAAHDLEAEWGKVLQSEEALLQGALNAIEHVAHIGV
ncbi:hypothetical protein [Methylophilus sp. Leaf408]|uniref:hypothetical protein n=1 Tax=Methylophilus sp. Leaf408 TaxID=2876561 RepID=UPI001E2F21CA|nr:hypothetical protein [Methylophilus sp. Leaf408]